MGRVRTRAQDGGAGWAPTLQRRLVELVLDPPHLPRTWLVPLVTALVAAVGALDHLSGSLASLEVLYVLVAVSATVVGGVTGGLTAAVLGTVVWGVAELVDREDDVSPWIDAWNTAVRVVVLALVVFLVTSLVRALGEARRSETASRAFLAAAAHQLRTPVAALRASGEALVLEPQGAEHDQLLANLVGESHRVGRLVSSLLRTARLDQGEARRLEPVDLVGLCVREAERRTALSGVDCRVEVDESGPTGRVRLDADATREALANLLENAARHATAAIDVRLSVPRRHIEVRVVDDGPGLPAGLEARAFERFVSLDGHGGSGLGLGIARDLTQSQGGDLVYREKAFVLTLPLVTE